MEHEQQHEHGPQFQWQESDHQHLFIESTTPEIATTMKQIISSIIPEASTLSAVTLDDTVTRNASVASFPSETSTVSLITEMLGNASTAVNTNSDILTEIVNGTVSAGMVISETSSDDAGLVAVTDAATTTIATNTNNLFNTVANTISSVVSTTTTPKENMTHHTNFQHNEEEEDKTLYIILGVILGILVIITVVLIILYKKFRNRNARSNVYCVTDLNEISVSSTNDQKITPHGRKY